MHDCEPKRGGAVILDGMNRGGKKASGGVLNARFEINRKNLLSVDSQRTRGVVSRNYPPVPLKKVTRDKWRVTSGKPGVSSDERQVSSGEGRRKNNENAFLLFCRWPLFVSVK